MKVHFDNLFTFKQQTRIMSNNENTNTNKYEKVNKIVIFGKQYKVKHKNNKTTNNQCCGYLGYIYKKYVKTIIRWLENNMIGIESFCLILITFSVTLLIMGWIIGSATLMNDINICYSRIVEKDMSDICVPILLEQCKQQMDAYTNNSVMTFTTDSDVLSCYKQYSKSWIQDGVYKILYFIFNCVYWVGSVTLFIVLFQLSCDALHNLYKNMKRCVRSSINKLDNSIPEIETDEMV